MSEGQTVILIAATASVFAVVGLLVAIGALRRQVRELAKVAKDLRFETMPLVAVAHRVVDQAATELERVGAVLESTESVHSTVDSASRLAYRMFANPVVKILAVKAGAGSGIRRFASGSSSTQRPSSAPSKHAKKPR